MNMQTIHGLLGAAGGALKSIFGMIKNYRERGMDFKIDFKKVCITLIEGAVGGLVIGVAFPDPVYAFLGGAGINELADINDLLYPK